MESWKLSRRKRALRDRLLDDGNRELRHRRGPGVDTGGPGAELINDLEHHPHAFVLGCIADRQVPAPKAWAIPSIVQARVGSFEIDRLAELDETSWRRVLRTPSPVHRYPDRIAASFDRATKRIVDLYGGDASRIWSDRPPSARLVRRFLEFHGAGPKIASMAANILVRDFHIRLRDFRYIDISADRHVVRVMRRLGFVEPDASEVDVIYAARELSPDFPGVFDVTLFRLGHDLCRPTAPRCAECPLSDLCDYALSAGGR